MTNLHEAENNKSNDSFKNEMLSSKKGKWLKNRK